MYVVWGAAACSRLASLPILDSGTADASALVEHIAKNIDWSCKGMLRLDTAFGIALKQNRQQGETLLQSILTHRQL